MNNNLEKKYICPYCNIEFTNSRKYGAHITNKHKYKQCNICKKIVKVRSYTIHLKSCIQKHKPYYCEKCGKLVTKKFGSGKFCSRKCANSRVITEHQKIKTSLTAKKNNILKERIVKNNYCIDCGKHISYYAKRCVKCNSKCIETRLKLSQKAKKKKFFTEDNSTSIFYGYIYLTENLINGSIYIGQHFTKNKLSKDNYYGSGIYLKRAINKYGRKNFKKTILFSGNCSQYELNQLEKYYIWLAKHNNSGLNCYNIAKGGRGCNF